MLLIYLPTTQIVLFPSAAVAENFRVAAVPISHNNSAAQQAVLSVYPIVFEPGSSNCHFFGLVHSLSTSGRKKSELKILPIPPVRANPKGLSSLIAVIHNKKHEFLHS